ncbi:hypothetical protein [Bauldia sp.]|uniref:hypothetical protein n=1 Tax=Bauldia sp. TaxID=2575872 RepID=UPI003BAAB3BA
MTVTRFIDGWQTSVARAPADALSSGLSAVEPLSNDEATARMTGTDESGEPSPDITDTFEPAPNGADTDAGRDDPPIGDDAGYDDAADAPPIDMPQSWSKDDREAWDALPRAQQRRLAERERARSAEVSRRLQEAAERSKAVEAEVGAARQVREQYASAIDQVSAQINAMAGSEFADVTSWDDVNRMATENPERFNRWAALRQQAEAVLQEQAKLQHQARQEQAAHFQAYTAEEDARFLQSAPEFADPHHAADLQGQVRAMLTDDYGIGPDELAALWNGEPMSLRDHRAQLVIRDALRYRQAKARLAQDPRTRPRSPPPQRPGSAPAKGEARNRALDRASKALDRTNSREAALQLMKLRGS